MPRFSSRPRSPLRLTYEQLREFFNEYHGQQAAKMITGPATRLPKLFVLDTNVILHDAGCIRNFEENDVAIPITVLEELDHFKKGNEDIHFQAREFLRDFDGMTGDVLSAQGASLGDGLGSIRVVLGGEMEQKLKAAFLGDGPDHRILNTALHLQRAESHRRSCSSPRTPTCG